MSTFSIKSSTLCPQNNPYTHHIQRLCQVLCSVFVGNIPVGRVVAEEFSFAFQSVSQALFSVDVLLASVDDTNESKLEGVNTSGEDVKGVGTGVHEVKFGENAYGSSALRVNSAGKFERI